MKPEQRPLTHDELIDWDRRFLWHPFTQFDEWKDESPLITVRGEGPYLIDAKGQRYLDATSSMWCNILGHHVPAIDQAMKTQIEHIAHSGLFSQTHEPAIRLAKKLVDVTPAHLSRVFFSDNGSTAMEVALKLAFQYWYNQGQTRRSHFIAIGGAYHGDTLGDVSVGDVGIFHRVFKPLLFPRTILPPPYDASQAGNHEAAAEASLKTLRRTLRRQASKVAAVVFEPYIQGASGVHVYHDSFMREAVQIAREHDVLVIFDEVLTGFGRLGQPFAMSRENLEPDLVALSKGLTNGQVPLAATLATETLFDAFRGEYQSYKTFYHGHTFTGYQLGCAVALATLEALFDDKRIEGAAELSTKIDRLLEGVTANPLIDHVRGMGLIRAIELKVPPGTEDRRWAHEIALAARTQGVLLRPLGNALVLVPSLAWTMSQLSLALDILMETTSKILPLEKTAA